MSHWLIGRHSIHGWRASPDHRETGRPGRLCIGCAVINGLRHAEILGVLVVAGTAAFGYVFPISIAIVILLLIVTISYEQTIHAYPGGGGAYIVARDNLGELPAQTAGAALLTDYILTVAVSISSGVAQIVSAFPALYPYRVQIAVALVVLVMLDQPARGQGIGHVFAIPTYFFVVMMFVTVGIGLFALSDRHAGHGGRPAGTGAAARNAARCHASSCSCTPSPAAPRR
ncbi:MAG: amino acid permease [Candidatus Moduliflexus flocculans]|nr:amino acid permease [Candidatus Moduliflexus flocculans]